MFPFKDRGSIGGFLDSLMRGANGFDDFAAAYNPAPPKLLSARDAAKLLGVSERTLWSMTHRGEIAAVRIGRRVLYDPQDLSRWIAGSKTPGSKCSAVV